MSCPIAAFTALSLIQVIAAAGSRQVTIRLNNSEIALAKKKAGAKDLRYQTYIKMLLHQALISDR